MIKTEKRVDFSAAKERIDLKLLNIIHALRQSRRNIKATRKASREMCDFHSH